jgi:Uma2 family endonuclease
MEINEHGLVYNSKKYSVEEYYAFENASIDKHEYYDGVIRDMDGNIVSDEEIESAKISGIDKSGNNFQHIIVTGNLLIELHRKLDSTECFACNRDLRIHVETPAFTTCPDISVFCGDAISLNNDDRNYLNPIIIIEVVSSTTRDYDKGTKFSLYRAIPSLQEYVLVEPESIYIEAWHVNEDGLWEMREYKSFEDAVQLDSIKVSILLKDVYEKTEVIERLNNKK